MARAAAAAEPFRERSEGGSPIYEAIVFIGVDPDREGYACLWLDSTGGTRLDGQMIGHAEPGTGDELRFVFGDDETSAIHTTFASVPQTDSWSWSIDIHKKDEARQFARLRMHRRGQER